MTSAGRRARVRARQALALGTKVGAEMVDLARRPERGVVVLAYHRIGGDTDSPVDLPVRRFATQMAELAGQAARLDDALATTGPPADGAADPVVVTFDDGTADFVDRALPILVEHGIPALVYVATDFVERGVDFPWGAPPLSWAALRDARATGLVEVGSHTHRHLLLDRLDAGAIDEELDRSISLLQERLDAPVRHFAYPKALPPSPAAERAVRARFETAALAGTRPNPYGRIDRYRLARSPIQVGDGMRWFRRKRLGGMAAEDTLRRVVNRSRYAGATT